MEALLVQLPSGSQCLIINLGLNVKVDGKDGCVIVRSTPQVTIIYIRMNNSYAWNLALKNIERTGRD